MPDGDFHHATLGRTGRSILRLGVGSSFGVGGRDLEMAVEEYGLGYLYWGSLRKDGFADAIRALNTRGLRDRLFVVVQSYSRLGSLVRPSLTRALKRLGIEQADMLLLGWWNKEVSSRIVKAALKCQERGLTRHIGVSTHKRPLVPGFVGSSPFDVVHFRYNAANRGAEQEIFPQVAGGPEERAGLVAFTATRWGQLLSPPGDGLAHPTAGDCYRFVLSRPEVDLCLSGPADGAQLRAALDAVAQGPMDPEQLAWMQQVGERVYNQTRRTRLAERF